jgi:hypothetical protein
MDFRAQVEKNPSGFRANDRFVPGKAVALFTGVNRQLEYFSLGGLLARVWTPRAQMLPWMVIASILVSVGAWGFGNAAGRVDFVLIASVAAYELIIGLTERVQRG